MIKQDYLLRMIQEIISLIANAILNKKKIRQQEWVEYDCLTGQIAMTLLKCPMKRMPIIFYRNPSSGRRGWSC